MRRTSVLHPRLKTVLHMACAIAGELTIVCAIAGTASGQPLGDTQPPLLGTTITVSRIGELPATASVLSILDTAIAEIIADRTDAGGLSLADPPRLGSAGSSWTQTRFRVGDVDITDPGGAGTPLLFPGIAAWDRTTVWTGAIPIDASAPGLAVAFTPRRPGDAWHGTVQASGSPSALNASPRRVLPLTTARLSTWADGTVIAGGPLISDRLATFMTVTAARSSYYERTIPVAFEARLASAFGSFVATPAPGEQVRGVVWADATRSPLATAAVLGQPDARERDDGVHVQATWEHAGAGTTTLRVFGGYTTRDREIDLRPVDLAIVERLRDGPVPALLDVGPGADHVWQFGARFGGTKDIRRSRHELTAGVDLAGSSMTIRPAFSGRIGEFVDGVPARVWDFSVPAAGSSWEQRTLTAYAADVWPVSGRLTIDAGLRFDATRGEAAAAKSGSGVSWNDLQPRAGVHARLVDFWQIGALARYARYGHRLPLRDLAYGDPTAPVARIYRWNGAPFADDARNLGPVVQRVGPGTGSDPLFSVIDPNLKRPHMDEVVLGFDSHPRPNAFARLVAIARREASLVGVVDSGVPPSTYAILQVRDPGIDLVGTEDDQLLTFYNRAPATFGKDQYLLTNPPDDVTTFVGVEATAEFNPDRLFVLFGATAGRSEGLAANRGYGPLENDAASIGDVFVDPNSRGHAQGRLFTERGYTLKTAIGYAWPHDFTTSLVARYQDGQHFARLVVLDDLNQGAEAVRAFRNGRTRFTYAMTVDLRMQKRFAIGRRSVAVTIDGFNVLNQALEAEEFQVTGEGPRQNLAVQTPRVLHVGVALTF